MDQNEKAKLRFWIIIAGLVLMIALMLSVGGCRARQKPSPPADLSSVSHPLAYAADLNKQARNQLSQAELVLPPDAPARPHVLDADELLSLALDKMSQAGSAMSALAVRVAKLSDYAVGVKAKYDSYQNDWFGPRMWRLFYWVIGIAVGGYVLMFVLQLLGLKGGGTVARIGVWVTRRVIDFFTGGLSIMDRKIAANGKKKR